MEMQQIESITKEVFECFFTNHSDSELSELKRDISDQWDSMLHVNLISALEGEFDVVIDTAAAINLNTMQDCVTLISALTEE
ncbi:acyl carrier protein [Reinekea sp. G2M2-21]|uniref:acyl carrier protein n=1 Tax=Reinekea sp. G2M2-21 TaxID=2788942 RepID=UPI0018A8E956|nr:acyl carrier protein [Reinekea sp. G2M2-21]